MARVFRTASDNLELLDVMTPKAADEANPPSFSSIDSQKTKPRLSFSQQPPTPTATLTAAQQAMGNNLLRRKNGSQTPKGSDVLSSLPKMQNLARDLLRKKATETRHLLAQQSPTFATSLSAGARSRHKTLDNTVKDAPVDSDDQQAQKEIDSVESVDDRFNWVVFCFTFCIEMVPVWLNSFFVFIYYGPSREFINVSGHRQLLPIKSLLGPKVPMLKFIRGQIFNTILSWVQTFWVALYLYYAEEVNADGVTVHLAL
jgi:hypothetical protein